MTAKQKEVLDQLLDRYAEQAVAEAKEYGEQIPDTNFSAEVGRELYVKRRSWSKMDPTCSNCHTDDPRNVGEHIETKKPIQPLAPAANPERFTDIDKVETNFTSHCMDLLDRDCEALEKGHFLTYLMSVK